MLLGPCHIVLWFHKISVEIFLSSGFLFADGSGCTSIHIRCSHTIKLALPVLDPYWGKCQTGSFNSVCVLFCFFCEKCQNKGLILILTDGSCPYSFLTFSLGVYLWEIWCQYIIKMTLLLFKGLEWHFPIKTANTILTTRYVFMYIYFSLKLNLNHQTVSCLVGWLLVG